MTNRDNNDPRTWPLWERVMVLGLLAALAIGLVGGGVWLIASRGELPDCPACMADAGAR